MGSDVSVGRGVITGALVVGSDVTGESEGFDVMGDEVTGGKLVGRTIDVDGGGVGGRVGFGVGAGVGANDVVGAGDMEGELDGLRVGFVVVGGEVGALVVGADAVGGGVVNAPVGGGVICASDGALDVGGFVASIGICVGFGVPCACDVKGGGRNNCVEPFELRRRVSCTS